MSDRVNEGYKRSQNKCVAMSDEEVAKRKGQTASLMNQIMKERAGTSIRGRRTYRIEDDFDGCEYDKYYALTNGMYLRCDQYKYFYKNRPEVSADGNKVYAIDDREVRGTIVQGETIKTQIEGELEGCDFDSHRLLNGMYLFCNTYFYEYAFMPYVEVLIINGPVKSVSTNGSVRDGVNVASP